MSLKSQITNLKTQTNPNDSNSNTQTVKVDFGHWIFGFEIYLEFGACNLLFVLKYNFSFMLDQTSCFSHQKLG